MARTDEAELAVRVEAKIRDFERNMDRASRKASQSFKRIETDAEKSANRLESSFARAGKGMAAGLKAGIAGVAAIGFAGVVKGARDTAREIANIGNEAKRAGLSIKAFQELAYVAKVNRISVDALVDGMKELNIRADEFIATGKGSGEEAFRRLGFGATELATKLKDPSALMVEIIGRMEGLEKAAQIRIADELFGGTGGERFVELLDQGAVGIRKLITEANDLGIIRADKMIAKADEIDRKFTKITETVGTGLKTAIVEAVDALDGFFDQFREIERQADFTIAKKLEAIYTQRQDLAERIRDLETEKASSFFPGAVDTEIKLANVELEKLTREAMRLRDVLDRRNGFSESFTFKAGEDAKGAKPKVEGLNSAVSGMNSAGASGASGINSFADAIRALKGEIPELADQLANLDAKAKIEGIYTAALANASSGRDAMTAGVLRDKAMDALDVKRATADSTAYLKPKLAAGRPDSYVEDLSSDFAEKLARMLASAPDDVRKAITINSGARSNARQAELFDAAVKKYGSEAKARKWVAPPGRSNHNSGNAADLGFGTDAARSWFHKNASGFGLSFPMGHEPWHIEDAKTRRQTNDDDFMERRNAQQAQRQKLADEQKAAIDKARASDMASRDFRMTENAEAARAYSQNLRDQAAAYGEIVTGSQRYTAEQGMERQALTMSAQAAAAMRYEADMLAEAQRAGIVLTPQQTTHIRALAVEMANAEIATGNFAQSQEEAKAAQEAFRGIAQGAVSGLISDLRQGKSAAEAFANVLNGIADKLIDMALNNLFANAFSGGSTGGGGGIFAAIGSLFGLKDGGPVPAFASGGKVQGPGGPRDDKVLAKLSNGEYVINAKQTAKHRALVEAINADRLPAFANGGMIAAKPLASPGFTSSRSNDTKPVTINSSVTVNASGGTPEQNADLARQTEKAIEGQMRVIVQQEMRARSRPGGGF